jgi:small subunit ribosomal protein S11
MGKKRIVKKGNDSASGGGDSPRLPKRHLESGRLYVEATYNNTKLVLTDENGNAVLSSSSGALGFSGAKKGTPFAAAKVGEVLGEQAGKIGLKEVTVIIRGVGSGRESSVRAFTSKGVGIRSITDMTPVPHNGPKAPKARRV